MNITQSQAISKLLGSVSISELPQIQGKSYEDYYVIYNQEDAPICLIPELTVDKYLASRVFPLMVDMASMTLGEIKTIQDAVKSSWGEVTPLTVGRWLAANRSQFLETTSTIASSNRQTISDLFLPCFQYYYFENIVKQKRTMLIWYTNTENDFTMNPNMWETHIPEGERTGITIHPVTINKIKKNFILRATESSDGEEKFLRRNYSQIVKGNGPDISCDENYDIHWGNTGFDNEIKDTQGNMEDRIGDIDMTLKSIGNYLDDLENSLDQQDITFPGMVIITTQTANNQISQLSNGTWDSDKFNGKFIFAKDGEFTTGGVDNVLFGNNEYIRHHHNTVTKNGNTLNRNVAMIGDPEGDTVGCVPVLDRLLIEDSPQNIDRPADISIGVSANRFFTTVDDSSSPFKGGVHYLDDMGITTEQKTHNNIPLYYTVRVFVKVS